MNTDREIDWMECACAFGFLPHRSAYDRQLQLCRAAARRRAARVPADPAGCRWSPGRDLGVGGRWNRELSVPDPSAGRWRVVVKLDVYATERKKQQ